MENNQRETTLSEVIKEFSKQKKSNANKICTATFTELFGCEDFSDIVVYVHYLKIPAHKVILASKSKIFNASIAEGKSEIRLTDVPIEIGKHFMQFFLRIRRDPKCGNIGNIPFTRSVRNLRSKRTQEPSHSSYRTHHHLL